MFWSGPVKAQTSIQEIIGGRIGKAWFRPSPQKNWLNGVNTYAVRSFYIVLINWHYFVEICFHFDIKYLFLSKLVLYMFGLLTLIPFIKAIKGENIWRGDSIL